MGSRDRTCPACNKQSYARLYSRYEKVILGSQHLKFLTLTAKPVPKQDSKIVRDLGSALTSFLHRHPYHHWKGLLAVIECKKTTQGLFYYHIHALFDGFYVPQDQISQDWKQCSGFPITWIEAVKSPKRAFKYVLKYVLKGFSFERDQDRLDFKDSMKGVRYIRSYGSYYDFYQTAEHVYFPCPNCQAVKSWVVWDYIGQVDLFQNVPYDTG